VRTSFDFPKITLNNKSSLIEQERYERRSADAFWRSKQEGGKLCLVNKNREEKVEVAKGKVYVRSSIRGGINALYPATWVQRKIP